MNIYNNKELGLGLFGFWFGVGVTQASPCPIPLDPGIDPLFSLRQLDHLESSFKNRVKCLLFNKRYLKIMTFQDTTARITMIFIEIKLKSYKKLRKYGEKFVKFTRFLCSKSLHLCHSMGKMVHAS